jgi:hypothetical protein
MRDMLIVRKGMLFFLRTLADGNKELICLEQMDKGGEETFGQERQTSVVLCPAVSCHDGFLLPEGYFFHSPSRRDTRQEEKTKAVPGSAPASQHC